MKQFMQYSAMHLRRAVISDYYVVYCGRCDCACRSSVDVCVIVHRRSVDVHVVRMFLLSCQRVE